MSVVTGSWGSQHEAGTIDGRAFCRNGRGRRQSWNWRAAARCARGARSDDRGSGRHISDSAPPLGDDRGGRFSGPAARLMRLASRALMPSRRTRRGGDVADSVRAELVKLRNRGCATGGLVRAGRSGTLYRSRALGWLRPWPLCWCWRVCSSPHGRIRTRRELPSLVEEQRAEQAARRRAAGSGFLTARRDAATKAYQWLFTARGSLGPLLHPARHAG